MEQHPWSSIATWTWHDAAISRIEEHDRAVPYTAAHVDSVPTRAEIAALPGVTVLEFGTSWCPHCIAAQSLLQPVLDAREDVRHLKVEDGPGRRLGRLYGVLLWPTVIVLHDGEERARVVRPTTREQIEDALAFSV